MSIGRRVIAAVAFHEVDDAPDADHAADRRDHRRECGNRRAEKFHKIVLLCFENVDI